MTHAPQHRHLPPRSPGTIAWTTAAAWFAVMLILGASGTLPRLPRVGPLSPIQVAIFLPVGLFAAAVTWAPPVRQWAQELDVTWLTGLQVMRILGCSHLVSWGLGLMAGAFAIPVGLGNLCVSLYALSILPGVSTRQAGWERRLRRLTMAGLAEFGMTIGLAITGFLAMATPLDPPMALDAYASIWRPPISVFPTFLIPFFSIAHIATLVRLRAVSASP